MLGSEDLSQRIDVKIKNTFTFCTTALALEYSKNLSNIFNFLPRFLFAILPKHRDQKVQGNTKHSVVNLFYM